MRGISSLHESCYNGFSLLTSLHPYLASIAILKFFKLLTPSPPPYLTTHNLSHDIHLIPLLLALFPDQKPFICFSIFSHVSFGIRNKLIQNFGTACAAVFRSVILPALDNTLLIHPCNLWLTQLVRKLNTSFLFLPTVIGSPKYFPGLLTSFTPSIVHINLLSSSEVFGLKQIFDLLKLIA